jgi:hypothetical protein
VTFSVYDQPSQAQSGGSTGRIVNKTGAYVKFAQSYQVALTADSAVADVEASPTFTKFTSGQTSGSLLKARLASLDYKLATAVPLKADGTAMTLAALMATGASGTKLTVTGDFSAAANTDGTFTGTTAASLTAGALTRVYLNPTNDCAYTGASINASSLSASAVSFNVGATATTANPHLCYQPNGTAQVAASGYTAVLNAVTAAAASYTVASIDKGTVSNITRNGTELQAPLFQAPGGYLSRFALTNTGTVAATYTAVVRGETGNTFSAGTLTGTIPAGGQVILNGSDLGTFSGSQRGFVVFTVNRPNTQIQGVFQLTNVASGAVTNTVMVRPGTN